MSNSVFRLARNDGCVPLGEHGKMASQQNSLSLTHREQLNFAHITDSDWHDRPAASMLDSVKVLVLQLRSLTSTPILFATVSAIVCSRFNAQVC